MKALEIHVTSFLSRQGASVSRDFRLLYTLVVNAEPRGATSQYTIYPRRGNPKFPLPTKQRARGKHTSLNNRREEERKLAFSVKEALHLYSTVSFAKDSQVSAKKQHHTGGYYAIFSLYFAA